MATSREMAKRCRPTRYRVRKPEKFIRLNDGWGYFKNSVGDYILCFGDRYFCAVVARYDSVRELRLSILKEKILFNT